MQTNSDNTYSRPARRKKHSYETVSVPPPISNKDTPAMSTKGKRASVDCSASSRKPIPIKSPSVNSGLSLAGGHMMRSGECPPPVPTSARPTSTANASLMLQQQQWPPAHTPSPPPLPPRQSIPTSSATSKEKNNLYSSPRPTHPTPVAQTNTPAAGSSNAPELLSIYNIPRSNPRPASDGHLQHQPSPSRANQHHNSIAAPQPTASLIYDSLTELTTPATAGLLPSAPHSPLEQPKPKPSVPALKPLTTHPSPTSEFTAVSKPMSLKKLVENHQNEFPLCVEVIAGYFGDSERDTFSEGDKLQIHFAKLVTVAVIECGGREIKVPLNSSLQFSPIYNPNNNISEAKNGFQFKTVKEIIAALGKNSLVPFIVKARKAQKSMNSAHGIEKGELLKIIEVKSGRFGGQSLSCASIDGKKLKRLSESCNGDFTTDPNHIKLYLPEITTILPLPQQAIPCINYMVDRDLPFADSEVVKILRVEKEKTIVATFILDEQDTNDSNSSSPVMFDIPVDLDVLEVQIVEHEEYEKLYADTKQLMERFDPTRKSDNQVRVGQAESLYYCDVREDQKMAGIELIASESIYQDTPSLLAMRNVSNGSFSFSKSQSCMSIDSLVDSKLPSSSSIPKPEQVSLSNSTESLEVYTDMTLRRDDGMRKYSSNSSLQDAPSYALHGILEGMGHTGLHQHGEQIAILKDDIEQLKLTVNQLTETVQGYERESSHQKSVIKELQETIQSLQEKMDQHGDYVQLVPSAGDECISNFTCNQLLEFLDQNNMAMYKGSFSAEQVDGALLAQLDEDILMNELGVKSKLHCRKLLLHAQGNSNKLL